MQAMVPLGDSEAGQGHAKISSIICPLSSFPRALQGQHHWPLVSPTSLGQGWGRGRCWDTHHPRYRSAW